MKIVIFAPHPDDEIFGCGGSILKWLQEGHDVHIIYVTDNRAWLEWGIRQESLIKNDTKPFLNLNGDDMAKICLKESEDVAKAFGFPESNVHLFKIHDQEAANNIDLGVSLSKEIVKDADRIVLPSNNNGHVDHQATCDIAVGVSKELNLKNVEFYVYGIYNVLKAPREKHIKIKIVEYRDKLYEIMKNYKTQLCLKDTRAGFETIKRKRTERFCLFIFEDMDKFYNF